MTCLSLHHRRTLAPVPAPPTERDRDRLRKVLNSWPGNVVTLVAAASVYFGVRHITQGSEETAERNADRVVGLERLLGVHRESWIQQRAATHGWIVRMADDVYIYGHWPFIIATLAWLLVRHRDRFTEAKNALLLSGGVALIVFTLFPVSPPRLADTAILDTVTLHTNAYRVLQPPAFTDAYAAMPSLHCGWDLLVATVLAGTVANRWVRGAIAVIPMTMAASVVITGNHYLLDVVAGDLLAGTALLVVRRLAARRSASGDVPETVARAARRVDEPLDRVTPTAA